MSRPDIEAIKARLAALPPGCSPAISPTNLNALIEYVEKLEASVERLQKANDILDDQLGIVRERAEKAEALIRAAVEGPPAEMSYAGRLVPINSTGMRELVDEATTLRRLLTASESARQAAEDQRQKYEDKIESIVAIANAHGWNGVTNSKILGVFIDQELTAKEQAEAELAKLHRDSTPTCGKVNKLLADAVADRDVVRRVVLAFCLTCPTCRSVGRIATGSTPDTIVPCPDCPEALGFIPKNQKRLQAADDLLDLLWKALPSITGEIENARARYVAATYDTAKREEEKVTR